jgi:cytidylate kinase
MSYNLQSYFEKRFTEIKVAKPTKKSVFITFSRQTGCNETGIAVDLVKALRSEGLKWTFMNKEVLEEAATKLKIDPSKIQYVFENRKKTHVDEVLSALSSKYYKSDKKVRKTITEVLRHYAIEGNIIIVGRAGIATTRDLPGGFHIRFTAPYDWRVNALKKRSEFKDVDVPAFIKRHDVKKTKLIEDFYGKHFNEIQFDLMINCAAFTRQQIISLIIESMKMKNMI